MTVNITISDALFKHISALAEEYEPLDDDFNAYDYSGGQCDDSFTMGVAHGEEELAHSIMGHYDKTKED